MRNPSRPHLNIVFGHQLTRNSKIKVFVADLTVRNICRSLKHNQTTKCQLDFCLTVHHQLGKVIQMNQLDATMIY